MWKPIETAPALDRIIVAGWAPPSGKVRGYWWWYEDYTDEHGKPMEWPTALMWHEPIPVPSDPPKQAKATGAAK